MSLFELYSDSCKKGWDLILICCTFFPSSSTLEPYLKRYLETNANDKTREFYTTATECANRLKKTKLHPRNLPPNAAEIAAIEVEYFFKFTNAIFKDLFNKYKKRSC